MCKRKGKRKDGFVTGFLKSYYTLFIFLYNTLGKVNNDTCLLKAFKRVTF